MTWTRMRQVDTSATWQDYKLCTLLCKMFCLHTVEGLAYQTECAAPGLGLTQCLSESREQDNNAG